MRAENFDERQRTIAMQAVSNHVRNDVMQKVIWIFRDYNANEHDYSASTKFDCPLSPRARNATNDNVNGDSRDVNRVVNVSERFHKLSTPKSDVQVFHLAQH
jgi:hypothetical protein